MVTDSSVDHILNVEFLKKFLFLKCRIKERRVNATSEFFYFTFITVCIYRQMYTENFKL